MRGEGRWLRGDGVRGEGRGARGEQLHTAPPVSRASRPVGIRLVQTGEQRGEGREAAGVVAHGRGASDGGTGRELARRSATAARRLAPQGSYLALKIGVARSEGGRLGSALCQSGPQLAERRVARRPPLYELLLRCQRSLQHTGAVEGAVGVLGASGGRGEARRGDCHQEQVEREERVTSSMRPLIKAADSISGSVRLSTLKSHDMRIFSRCAAMSCADAPDGVPPVGAFSGHAVSGLAGGNAESLSALCAFECACLTLQARSIDRSFRARHGGPRSNFSRGCVRSPRGRASRFVLDLEQVLGKRLAVLRHTRVTRNARKGGPVKWQRGGDR